MQAAKLDKSRVRSDSDSSSDDEVYVKNSDKRKMEPSAMDDIGTSSSDDDNPVNRNPLAGLSSSSKSSSLPKVPPVSALAQTMQFASSSSSGFDAPPLSLKKKRGPRPKKKDAQSAPPAPKMDAAQSASPALAPAPASSLSITPTFADWGNSTLSPQRKHSQGSSVSSIRDVAAVAAGAAAAQGKGKGTKRKASLNHH